MVVGDEDGAVAMMEHHHSHQFALPTLMPVSSEASAVPAISRALIRLVCAAKVFRLAERMFSTSAPSLISRPNKSRSTWLNRASGIPTERR